jgi:signal transduction histidine kinase
VRPEGRRYAGLVISKRASEWLAQARASPRQTAFDVGLAFAAFAGTVAILAGRRASETAGDARALDAWGVLLAAAASLPLLASRRAPLTVFGITASASALLNFLDYPPGPPLGPTIALFFVALRRDETRAQTRRIAAVVATLLVVHLASAGVAEDRLPLMESLFAVAVWGGAWFAGDRTRLRRERLLALEERARRAERDAARDRRLAATEERMRIARDLHDSAGHAINVILVQAGAARLLADRDPERSQAALETIEEVARETVTEIDQLVGSLRDDGRSREDVEPPTRLRALETLIERHRRSGLDVALRVRGEERALPASVDRAAFRILQEALTNAAKHGDGNAAIDVNYRDEAVELTVTNPVREHASAGEDEPHHGLIGMRERVALVDGELRAGRKANRFELRARIPYRTGAR